MFERIQQCIQLWIDWAIDPIGGWAGRRWGFFDTINSLEKQVGALENQVETMHEYYMAAYRKIETDVAELTSMALPELRIRMSNVLINRNQGFIFNEVGHLMMATDELETSAKYDEANCRTIITTGIKMGFAFDDFGPRSLKNGKEKQDYAVAIGLAKKASEMAYDAVMKDCGQRLPPIFQSSFCRKAK